MVVTIEDLNKIIESLEDRYDTLLIEDAIQDKEGVITDEELDRLLGDQD